MSSCILGNIYFLDSHIISHISHQTLPSNPLDCRETSIPKFKVSLQKEFLQLGEVMVILTGDTSCHIQGLCIDEYDLVSMQHEKVSCLLIVNGDSHLVRDIEDRLVSDHSEGALWVLKSLELHEMIMRDEDYALEVRHEDTSDFQNWNLPFVVNHFIVKGSLMVCFQGDINYVHEVGIT